MPYYRSVGDVPRKRHVAFMGGSDARLHEELMGQEGFSSRSALLYHHHAPSEIVAIEPIADANADAATPDHPMTPRHLRTSEVDVVSDPVMDRRVLLGNSDLVIAWASMDRHVVSPLYRNACGDELVYVQRGDAVVESVFGRLSVGQGDYVVLPASVTHRWVTGEAGADLLITEARGHVMPPKRYLSDQGQFLEHSPYCERDVRGPEEPLVEQGENVDVVIRAPGGLTRHTHRHHPFDVVGWDGHLYPWAFNIRDFEPIVGRVHQPPPVHQTFEGPGFVVCSFVPRLYDFHPEAVKVPYHHANTDSDEVLFYSDGNFMSRSGSGIGRGSISYHPAGFIHGPQPGSYEASIDQTAAEETAVMIDTFRPLGVTDVARSISASEYPWSWTKR